MAITVQRQSPSHSGICAHTGGRKSGGQKVKGSRNAVAVALASLMITSGAYAAGQVSSISTSLVPATPFIYTMGGIEYQWGMGSNQLMEGFVADGSSFSYAQSADRVEIKRDDIPGVTTGEPCGIFVERLSLEQASRQFAADYPSDGSGTGNCDLPALLASRVINRGAVDLFSNTLPDAKNIERLDYVFDYGVLAPFDGNAMDLAGHVVSEKASNNPLKIAAILALDVFGQPASYGPLVLVGPSGCSEPASCYGVTDLQHRYSFLQNDLNVPQGYPVETERSVETVGMALVSASKLGLKPGQRYYGFSLFADDVSAELHNLLDPVTFPSNTSDDNVVIGDEADVYGGLSGFFIADDLSVTTGAVFFDTDGSGTPDDTEAGISDITVTLYVDANGNGIVDEGVDQPLGDSIDTDMSGNFVLPGIPDGNYIVVMNEQDPELPPGLESAPGTNPHPLIVAGGDSEPVYFPFIDPNGGSTGGATDSGTVDGGNDGGADGATDSGTVDGGVDGATDSGTDDGGADGATDSGTDDGGVDGATDSGTVDGGVDGATDSGTDDGGVDGATDSGTVDGGVDGATDSGTDDGGVDGATDSGTDGGVDGATDSGTVDGGVDGATDSGTDDGGVDGATDSGTDGGVDGATDGGADGATDSGTDDGGVDGATDSGTVDGGVDGATDSGTDDGGADGATDSGTDDGGVDGATDGGTGDGGTDGGTDGGLPPGDATTDAIDDEYKMNQGRTEQERTEIFNVLLNDVDGVGDGLTLVSVSESPNATITITPENEIRYVSKFGFYGKDTFIYVMQDSEGAESSGNVSVEVIRYIDLNNNLQNDYVECDCTNLALETGIHGSGVGGLSFFGAWLLLMGVILRRAKSRVLRQLVRRTSLWQV